MFCYKLHKQKVYFHYVFFSHELLNHVECKIFYHTCGKNMAEPHQPAYKKHKRLCKFLLTDLSQHRWMKGKPPERKR